MTFLHNSGKYPHQYTLAPVSSDSGHTSLAIRLADILILIRNCSLLRTEFGVCLFLKFRIHTASHSKSRVFEPLFQNSITRQTHPWLHLCLV